MAEIVQSLFGVSPEMYQQRQEDQASARAMQFARLTPIQQANYAIGRGAYGLAGALGGALGGQDPELQRITMRQQIASQLNPNDPASIEQAISALMQAGDTQGGMMLQGEYRKLQESGALVAQRMGAAAASDASARRERAPATTPDITNARALALRAGPEGSPDYIAAFNTELQRLTTKPERAETRSEIQKLLDELGSLDPVKDKQRYDSVKGRITILTTREPRQSLSVSIPPQEKSEQVEYGKDLVSEYRVVRDKAAIAVKSIPSLQIQTSIIDAGFKTGFGAPAQAAAASVLAALGVKDVANFATNAQTFYSASQGAVLQKQLEQKGPQTESDAKRITATGAQLGNTPEANKFIINVASAQFKRDIKQSEFWSDWRRKNKTYDGAENAWMTGDGAKSLFDYPELKSYKIGQESSNDQGTWRVRKK